MKHRYDFLIQVIVGDQEPIPDERGKIISLWASDIWDALIKFRSAYEDWQNLKVVSIIEFN